MKFGLGKLTGKRAPTASDAPLRARVHAVRRLASGPDPDETPREWYAVELTGTAGADVTWSPLAFEPKGPDQPEDEGAWGYVADARCRRGKGWVAVGEEPLAGEQRVRLLIGMWPGAPTDLVLRLDGERVGRLDLSRAERFQAGGAAPAPAPKKARPKAAAAARPATGKGLAALGGLDAGRKRLLVGAIAAFVVVNAAVFGWGAYQNQAPAATAEQHYEQRLGVARGGVEAFKATKRKLPADAAELAAFLKAAGGEPITLADESGSPPKDAVVYVRKADAFELYATTATGERYQPSGEAPAAQD